MKKPSFAKVFVPVAIVILLCLAGCKGALERGMLGNVYISNARPSISIDVPNLPLLTAGEGMPNLIWTDVLGGLPIQVWLAVYGTGGLAPLAIAAQAEVPGGWHWDADLYQTFSVDKGIETFNGEGYQACTFVINPARDPFGKLATAVQPDGTPQLWIVRYYAARFNFNDDKIILEYREPLPPAITDLNALPLGHANYLQEFAQRARAAFVVKNGPANLNGVRKGFAQGVAWQNMGQNFLGTASRYEPLRFD